jgi:hypothetical protein
VVGQHRCVACQQLPVAKDSGVGLGDFELPLSDEQCVVAFLHIAGSLNGHASFGHGGTLVRACDVYNLAKFEKRCYRLRRCDRNQSLVFAGQRYLRRYCSPPYGTFYSELFTHELVEVEVRERGTDLWKVVRFRAEPVLPGRFHLKLR